jgi:hypothetical protein
MGPRKFAISIYPGVYTDQVDAIVDILQTIPDAKISLIGPRWEPFEGIASDESRTTRMLEPTDTFHNPPDEGIQVFIIPDGEQSYDDHRSFRDTLSRRGVLGFLRAISPQNMHSILTIGTAIVFPARANMLAGKNAATTPENVEWVRQTIPSSLFHSAKRQGNSMTRKLETKSSEDQRMGVAKQCLY